MAVMARESLWVCNAGEHAASSLSHVDAPERCLSAYRASDRALADGRLFQKQLFEGKADSNVPIPSQQQHVDKEMSFRASRSVDSLRRKRLKRNKKKREVYKMMPKSEKKAKHLSKIKEAVEHEIWSKTEQQHRELNERFMEYKIRYENEKKKKRKSFRVAKNIRRENLVEIRHENPVLGSGAFGVCKKMLYRGITVAVKTFQEDAKIDLVKWEADVLNLFDHPGLPLLFGASLDEKPYQLVLQFHGIDGKCVTISRAVKSMLQVDWVRICKEAADGLDFMHKKGFLHNDLKGDNVLLSNDNNVLHPVIIDFGKCRSITNPKRYSLTAKEQRKYKKYHRHIAPELVEGTHAQSCESDIYSYGFLLAQITRSITCTKKRTVLDDISLACIRRNTLERPTLMDIVLKLK